MKWGWQRFLKWTQKTLTIKEKINKLKLGTPVPKGKHTNKRVKGKLQCFLNIWNLKNITRGLYSEDKKNIYNDKKNIDNSIERY